MRGWGGGIHDHGPLKDTCHQCHHMLFVFIVLIYCSCLHQAFRCVLDRLCFVVNVGWPEFLYKYSSTFFKAANPRDIAIKKHFPNKVNKKLKTDMYIQTPNAFLEANPENIEHRTVKIRRPTNTLDFWSFFGDF